VNGKPLREADLERVLEYVRLGFTVRAAAEALERPASTLYVVLNHEDVKDRYEEAKQVGHDARADRMREAILVHAEDGNTKALEIGSRWVPELRDTKRVEVTGANGAALEVAVDHDFGRILGKLEQVGLLRLGPAVAAEAETLDGSEPRALLPARTD
jgi:uncharacterized protein (UPF0335 family)